MSVANEYFITDNKHLALSEHDLQKLERGIKIPTAETVMQLLHKIINKLVENLATSFVESYFHTNFNLHCTSLKDIFF